MKAILVLFVAFCSFAEPGYAQFTVLPQTHVMVCPPEEPSPGAAKDRKCLYGKEALTLLSGNHRKVVERLILELNAQSKAVDIDRIVGAAGHHAPTLRAMMDGKPFDHTQVSWPINLGATDKPPNYGALYAIFGNDLLQSALIGGSPEDPTAKLSFAELECQPQCRGRIRSAIGLGEAKQNEAPGASCQIPNAGTINVKIGHAAPMSGNLAHLGLDNENGARMAIEALNEKCVLIGQRLAKFELVSQDDAADPATGVQAATRLVEAKVNGVVGHLNSGTTIPAAKIYRDAGIPQISPSATNPRYTHLGYKTAFRMLANDHRAGYLMGKYAVEVLKAQRIAVIDDRTAYGSLTANAFEEGVKQSGGATLWKSYVNVSSMEFSALLAKIKATRPDVVFFGGMDDEAGPLLGELAKHGIQLKFLGSDGICSKRLATLAGDRVVDGMVYCSQPGGIDEEYKSTLSDFATRYQRRFGGQYQFYAPYVFDAVNALVQAMQYAGSSDSKKYLPLLSRKTYKGVTGTISFDDKGDNKNGGVTIFGYPSGKLTPLTILY